jgi:hypothetical protein
MSKGQIFAKYKHFSPQDQVAFGQWLRANLVANALLAVVAVTVALSGSRTPDPSVMAMTGANAISVQELHSSPNVDKLPVEHIHNQALVFVAPEREARFVLVLEGINRRMADAH